jgi:Outer membrane protein beta-barrel domain
MILRGSIRCSRPTLDTGRAPHGAGVFVGLFSAFALLLAPGITRAQEDALAPSTGEPRFYGGARYLVSMADVSAAQEYDPRFGVGGGLYVAGTAWKPIDIRIEGNYVQKGGRIAFGRTACEWQLDYFEFPVLAVYNVMPRSQTSFEICAGVAYGLSVQQQVEESDNLGYDLDAFLDQNITLDARNSLVVESVENNELSFAIGMGLSVPVGAANFTVDVRYNRSITDPIVTGRFEQVVGDGATATIQESPADLSNRVFCFFIGFEFPFGSRTASGSE